MAMHCLPSSESLQRSGIAYMIAKRVNHLQAQKAAATTWKERRARINTIRPGVIVTPLAYDDLSFNSFSTKNYTNNKFSA